MSEPEPSWSPEQADRLQHEAFVAEILRRRAKSDNSKEPKSRWQSFLESSGGTALVTVVIGGLIGSWVTGQIQTRTKDREFEQAWVKARGDQALVAYKDYLEQQQQTMKHAFSLIGHCISASDDLIQLTGPDFDPTKYVGVEEQKTLLRKNYNACDKEWRTERGVLGLSIGYYHNAQPKVLATWNDVKDALTNYVDCAADWYLSHSDRVSDTAGACKAFRDTLEMRLGQLNKASSEAQRYAWEGWESPEALRAKTSAK